jgi:hypothetical protein
MERRKFIICGVTSLAGLSLLSFPLKGLPSAVENYPLLPEFLPKEIVRSIGIEYLKIDPDYKEKNFAALRPEQLVDLVKADFEKDNTIVVAGWVLSKTEAQHCAFLFKNK